MRKKIIIFFVLAFISGLASFNFIQNVRASDIPTPMAYWNFNDKDAVNAGLASDQMGNYNMQIVDGTWDSNGYDGGSIIFSCMKTDYNACGAKVSNALPQMHELTILYRVKFKGPINNTLRRIVAGGISMDFDGNSVMISGNIDEPINISDNWYHFAVVYDNEEGYYFYKNGNLAKYSSTSGNRIDGGVWTFGWGGGVQGDASANIIELDEIKIYNTALTPKQISEEYSYNEIRCDADTYQYGEWGACQSNSTKTRIATKTFDCPYANNEPENITTSCIYVPVCTLNDWSCTDWGSCSSSGSQIRTCSKTSSCQGGVQSPTTQSCVYTPACTSFTYSSWSECSVDGKQTRSVISKYPSNCDGGASPKINQSCIYTPLIVNPGTTDECVQIAKNIKYWKDLNNGPVDPDGIGFSPSQISEILKVRHEAVLAQLKILSNQAKEYQCDSETKCTQDTWQCDNWGACLPQGIQTRSCKKTYDCPSTETPPPATSQYCQTSYQPQTPSNSNNAPSSNNTINESTNQDSIIQATVKLICLINTTSGKQGSGTVIDPKGIILTNRHVVEGTKGCMVGFINSSDDDPSFTEAADVVKLSNDEDMALIKIRNDSNKTFIYSDISTGAVNSKNLGNKIMIFGYPSIGGDKLTYSDGAVSGFGSAKDGMGNYIKTTAIIEHGNSGGGAYLANNGTFIGIPSAGIKGELASIGYILSVNKIKSWISGSGLAYNGNGFSNLSSKSIKASSLLKNVNVNNIDILDISSAKVSIYSSKTKATLLPNNPGTIQVYNRPTFQINNVDEESDVVGYYMYFGTNMKADPVKKGKLFKKPEYLPSTITQKGSYYFIFRAKNKNGNISESVITEYRYKK